MSASGGVEAERDAGQHPDLGVGGFDQALRSGRGRGRRRWPGGLAHDASRPVGTDAGVPGNGAPRRSPTVPGPAYLVLAFDPEQHAARPSSSRSARFTGECRSRAIQASSAVSAVGSRSSGFFHGASAGALELAGPAHELARRAVLAGPAGPAFGLRCAPAPAHRSRLGAARHQVPRWPRPPHETDPHSRSRPGTAR